MFKKLREHWGHRVVIVSYGDTENPTSMSIECEDCNDVILSVDNPLTEGCVNIEE